MCQAERGLPVSYTRDVGSGTSCPGGEGAVNAVGRFQASDSGGVQTCHPAWCQQSVSCGVPQHQATSPDSPGQCPRACFSSKVIIFTPKVALWTQGLGPPGLPLP